MKKKNEVCQIFWKSEWDGIIFFDEKKFNLDRPDKCQYYWHYLQKDPEFFKKRIGGRGSVMVWGGISVKRKSDLAILTGCQNSKKLKNYLLPFSEKFNRRNLFSNMTIRRFTKPSWQNHGFRNKKSRPELY